MKINKNILKNIYAILNNNFNDSVKNIKVVYGGGSNNRIYYNLLTTNNKKIIVTQYYNKKEYYNFFKIYNILKSNNILIPEILYSDNKNLIYFQEYAGTTSVYKYIQKNKNNGKIIYIYKKNLDILLQIQSINKKKINKLPIFNKQNLIFEINYFCEFVLEKFYKVNYNKKDFLNEFKQIHRILIKTPPEHFMHRDFQSQNILYYKKKLFIIDYQSAYRNNIYYDLVSLIEDPYVSLSQHQKQILINYYNSKKTINYDLYQYSAMQRLMQASAAYIKLGYYLNKYSFRKFLKPALSNLKIFFKKNNIKSLKLIKDF